MSDNEKLMRRAEGQARYRRILLVINALSYVVWLVTFTLGMTGAGHLPHMWLVLISLAVFPFWAISLVAFLLSIARLRRDPQLGALLDDERTQAISQRAFQAGYWSLIVAITILWALSYVMPLDIRLCVPLLAAIGVAMPSLTYAALYRS